MMGHSGAISAASGSNASNWTGSGNPVQARTAKFLSPVYKMYGVANADDQKILDATTAADNTNAALASSNEAAAFAWRMKRTFGDNPIPKSILGQ